MDKVLLLMSLVVLLMFLLITVVLLLSIFINTVLFGTLDIDIDIAMKSKSGESYDNTTPIYVIVYGVKGHQNDVNPRILNRIYYIENRLAKFDVPINMSNKQIKNLPDNDAVNIKQLNEMETNITQYVQNLFADQVYYRGNLNHSNSSSMKFYVNSTAAHNTYIQQSDNNHLI